MTTGAPLKVTVLDGHRFVPVDDNRPLSLPIQFNLDGQTVVCTTVEELSDHMRTRAIRNAGFYGRADYEAYLKMLFGVRNTGPRILRKFGECRTISFS